MEINMRSRYQKMSSEDLRRLYSQKFVRLQKVSASKGWWNQREYDTLVATMKQIEAELNCRSAQLALF